MGALSEENIFLFSVVVIMLATILLIFARYSFKIRAITNKKPWDKKTKSLAVSAIFLMVIGLAIFYVTYPY